MASHARGRSLLGDSTAPSSIARRLQPSRRPPNQNDAHIAPTRLAPVRPATPRPPRARPLALPSGSSSDRDGPPAEPTPRPASTFSARGTTSTNGSTSRTSVNTRSSSRASSDDNRSTRTPPNRTPSTSASTSSSDVQRRASSRPEPTTRQATPSSTSTSPSPSTASSVSQPKTSTSRSPDWTTFVPTPSTNDDAPTPIDPASRRRSMIDSTPSSDSPRPQPSTTTPSTSSSPASPTTAPMSAPSPTQPTPRTTSGTPTTSSSPTASTLGTTTRPNNRLPDPSTDTANLRRSWTAPSWRRSVGLPELDEIPSEQSTSVEPPSSLAERVARLTEQPTSSDQPSELRRRTMPRAGDLVRRSPSSSVVLSALAASPTPTPAEQRVDTSRRLTSSPATDRGPRTSMATTSSRVEAIRSTLDSTADAPRVVSDASRDVRSSRTTPERRSRTSGPSSVAVRRQFALDTVRRSTGSRATESPKPSAVTALPGGSGPSPFIGLLARSIGNRQSGGSAADSWTSSRMFSKGADVRRNTSTGSASPSGPSVSSASPPVLTSTTRRSGPRATGAGPEAAAEFSRRLAERDADASTAPSTDIPSRPTIRRSVADSNWTTGVRRPESESGSGVPAPPSPSEIAARVSRSMNDSAAGSSIAAAFVSRPSAGSDSSWASISSPTGTADSPVSRSTGRRSPIGSTSTTARTDSTASGFALPSRRFDPGQASAVASRGRLRRSLSSPTRTARRTATRDAVLPVAPVVLSPAGGARSVSKSDESTAVDRASNLSDLRRRRSPVVVRRSSRSSGSPMGSASDASDGSMSADDMARMLENGFEPTPSIRRTVSPVLAATLGRNGASNSSPTSSSTIRRSTTGLPVAPGPVQIVGQVSGESPASGVTTSQLLDLMDWINRIVDERLRNELERRGIAGGRW